MKTLVTDSPTEAASFLVSGDVVAFPTETVYGLGADALSEESVRKIFAAKERPIDNPLIVHVAAAEQIGRLAESVPTVAERLMERFFPGPLTIILPRTREVPDVVTAGLPTIGIRMPAHPAAREFLRACDVPVAAPSANLSGRPSPTTWEAVLADLDGRIPCVLRGERSAVGLESTVVDCTEDVPVILRTGAVSLEELREIVPDVRIGRKTDFLGRSPGTKYRHYSPETPVRLVDRPPSVLPEGSAFIGLEAPSRSLSRHVRICATVEDYARELFDFFRHCDESDVREIICQKVSETGLGLAVMDRLQRASAAE